MPTGSARFHQNNIVCFREKQKWPDLLFSPKYSSVREIFENPENWKTFNTS